jgi:prepilin-type N-terminal cleavage/methylation domain-containing protein
MSRHRYGFTLIEVLMVVVIMAVLAATIIPQFSASANDAKLSNLKFNLRSIRAQLEKYKEEHLGSYPPAASHDDFLNQMIGKTDRNTNLNVRGACGPYIETGIPSNPFNNSATVTIILGSDPPTAPTGSGDGWQYNPAQGWFYPNDNEYFRSTGSFAKSD